MEWLKTRKGMTLIESILSTALLGILVTTLGTAYIAGNEATILSSKRTQAMMLAQEGLDAVTNIRDADFSNLVDGTHGIAISSNTWNLSGTSDTEGIFTRAITISSIDAERKNVLSTVTWDQNAQRTGSVSLETRLTNWQQEVDSICDGQEQFLGINTSNISENNDTFTGITLTNNATNCSIVIDSVFTYWIRSNGRRLQSIDIGGTEVWSGNSNAYSTLDITDYELGPGETQTLSLEYNNTNRISIISVEFRMTDGTSETMFVFTP